MEKDSSFGHFYLNLVLLNGNEVIKGQVAQKAGTGVFGKVIGGAAAKLVTDEALLAKVTVSLEEKLKTALDDLGLQLKFVKVFRKKCLTSYRVNLEHMDKVTLLVNTKGEEFAAAYSTMLSTLIDLGLEEKLPIVDERVNEKVRSRLMDQLEAQIPEKLAESGVKCSVRVLSAAEQADYFFDVLQEIS